MTTTSHIAEQEIDLYIDEFTKQNEVNEETFEKNIKKLSSFRFFTSIHLGIISGILNFTGFLGFMLYIIGYLLIGLILNCLISKNKTYFREVSLISHGLFEHIMTYLIFWVMIYNFIHIY
jgi:hypothetical protein